MMISSSWSNNNSNINSNSENGAMEGEDYSGMNDKGSSIDDDHDNQNNHNQGTLEQGQRSGADAGSSSASLWNFDFFRNGLMGTNTPREDNNDNNDQNKKRSNMKTGRNISNNTATSTTSRLYDCTTSMMMVPKEHSVKFRIGDGGNNIVFPETTKRKLAEGRGNEQLEQQTQLQKQQQQQQQLQKQKQSSMSRIVSGCNTPTLFGGNNNNNNNIAADPTSDVDDDGAVLMTTVDSVLGRVFCDNDNAAADNVTTARIFSSEDYGDDSEEGDLASRSDTTTTTTTAAGAMMSKRWLAMRRSGYGCGSPTATDSIANTSISTAAVSSVQCNEPPPSQDRQQQALDRQNSLLPDDTSTELVGMMHNQQIPNVIDDEGHGYDYNYDNDHHHNEEKKDDSWTMNVVPDEESQPLQSQQRLWRLRQKKRSIENTYSNSISNNSNNNNNNNSNEDLDDFVVGGRDDEEYNNDIAAANAKGTYNDEGLEKSQNCLYITPDFRIRQEPDIYYKDDDVDDEDDNDNYIDRAYDEEEASYHHHPHHDGNELPLHDSQDDDASRNNEDGSSSPTSEVSVSTAVKKRLERRMIAMKAVIAVSTVLVVGAIIVFILSFIIHDE